jgi:hypothetical protein
MRVSASAERAEVSRLAVESRVARFPMSRTQMTRFEKLTLGVSVAALAVSLLSAGASVWIYQKTMLEFRRGV